MSGTSTKERPLMKFEVREGARAGEVFEVGPTRVILGSEPDCEIALPDPEVSGEHASLKTLDGHVEVHDLGSRTGTFVNGNKILAPTLVGPGDQVKVGAEVLTVMLPTAPAVEETPAVTEPTPAEPPPPTGGGAVRRMPLPGRWMIAIAAVVVVIVAVVVVVLVSGGGNGALSTTAIIKQDKPATVLVIARGAPGSPLVELNGGSDILGGGSGWVYDASRGLIVTNAHVVVNGATVQVGYDASSLTAATIVGVDLANDIAVLKVPPAVLTGLKTLPRATPASVQQGAAAYALGFPGNSTTSTNFLKTPFQLTDGTLSATSGVRAQVNTDTLGFSSNDNSSVLMPNLYQTDAAINPGNSGGPLVNNHGQLVGMNVAGEGSAQSQGYAIPIGTIETVVPKLAGGSSSGWPGFGASAIPSSLADKWSISGGLIVTSVTKDTPADQAGMSTLLSSVFKAGDFLLLYKVNGQSVTTAQQYYGAMKQVQSGERVKFSLAAISPSGSVHAAGNYTVTFP